MEVKGKVLCGIVGIVVFDLLGIPFGGLIGFIFGSAVGHYLFDLPKEINEEQGDFKKYQRRQGAFLFHVFSLGAKIAKSDGPINSKEVAYMEQLMRYTFKLTDPGRKAAIHYWNKAKANEEPFETMAKAFYNDFAQERHHIMNMMDLLFAIAAADGGLHRQEEQVLLRAAGVFHIGRLQYERIKSRYYTAEKKGQNHQGRGASWSPLDPHYLILGAKSSDSLDTIKKKYRALALQWHPDKVTSNGATPEAVRHAKEKFQQINEAYEKITESRKK